MNTKAQTVRDAGKAPHIAITASQMRKQRAQRRKERDERSRGYDIRKLEERERAASVASDSPNTRHGQANDWDEWTQRLYDVYPHSLVVLEQ